MAVSVTGADGQPINLDQPSANMQAAQQVANTIEAQLRNNAVTPVADPQGGTEFFPTGATETPGSAPYYAGNYNDPVTPLQLNPVASPASPSNPTGSQVDIAVGGNGMVDINSSAQPNQGNLVVGNGNANINLAGPTGTPPVSTDWNVDLGSGNNQLTVANNNANITVGVPVTDANGNPIAPGAGNDQIALTGSGDHTVNNYGNVIVDASGTGKLTTDQIHGNEGNNMTFIGGQETANVSGGMGANNFFEAGSGNQTFTAGSMDSGNGKDQFTFDSALSAGAHVTINDFHPGTGQDSVVLKGYSATEISNALNSAVTANGNSTITMGDGTTITFTNVPHLSSTDF